MSIKNLFGKATKSAEVLAQDVESVKLIEKKEEKSATYLPPIDFSDPSNFVYYGSAELYYSSSISNIYSNYPYDGSRAEQLEFESKFTHLDRWLFENKYPKTTGLINLGSTADTFLFNPSDVYAKTNTPEYIRVWGGLHTDNSANKLADKFSKSAKFDEETNRVQNWLLDFQQGSSIEFWMKKDSYDAVNEPNEVILDLWNSESVGTSNYRRLILQLDSSAVSLGTFKLILESGTTSLTTRISSNDVDIVSLSDWAHYAITIVETTSGLNIRFYKNGNEDKLSAISFSWSMYGRMNAFIGAMQTNRFDGEGGLAYGKLNASLDEFRFWKSLRSSRQIKLNWFSQVGGGANTDDDTSDLGVYFKFNEGIVGTNSIDKTVLDYSGRIANGLWFGYENTTSARSTESAIEIHGYSETPTPIIYETHPDIISLVSEMYSIGNAYDNLQGQNLYNSFPQWITEEDEKEQNLKKLVQIVASYLDSLNIQIKTLPNLKEKKYTEEGYVPSPYMKDALLDKGFQVSDIFSNDEIFEKMSSLNLQDNQFEKELVEIKNLIYTNIYNNLEKIYKAKGTENSIRNFIRCFGIDDELIRLNQYTDNGKQYLTDKARTTSVKKKYLNLNREDSFNATIYQTSSLSNPLTFISGSTSVINGSKNAFTLEADIYLPYKKEIGENGYFATPFISSSVFGFHEAIDSNPSDYTFASNYGFQVYVVKPSESSRDAKFVLKLGSTTLGETDWFYDAYHNTHWNLALRIKPETYPFGDSVTNTAPDYNFDLFVVSNDLQTGSSDFVSYQLQGMLGNSDGERIMSRAKRVYAGAHYQNFTGSLLEKTDIEIGRVSAWFDYLENAEIKQHNVDPLNYGTLRSVYGANLSTLDNYNIPASEMFIFTWDFDTVSSSDSSGEFEIDDITSGSTDTIYGWIDDVIRREYKGKGQNFVAETSDFLTNEFIVSQRKQLPESSFDSDKIYIKGEQEINFSDDEDVSDNLFLMEKSPSSILSDQIINTFSTIKEFSNLFGKPIDRYRVEYKELNKARELFFQRTNSDLDFDKFFEYFKWIDSSVSKMISQLVPLSTNFYSGVLDTVESHILERNKYQRQVGLLQTIESTEASIRGTQELSYNWKYGHKPLTNDEADNCNWWLERNERVEPEREQIKNVIIGQNVLPANNLSKTDGTIYSGNAYAISRLSKTYKVDTEIQNTIHGGINFDKNKDRDFLRTGIGLHSSLGLSGAPKNVVTFGAGPGTGLVEKKDCNDVYEPNKKIKFDGFGIVGIHTDYATVNYAPLSDEVSYFSRRKISHIFPGNIIASDVTGGYAENINKAGSAGGYLEGVNVVNLHSDTTDITNEIPIQGPFTQQWTGGHQSRHVALNSVGKPKIIPSLNDLDDNFSRPEGYRFLIGKNPLVSTNPNSPDPDIDGAIGFTAPDYGIGTDGNFPDEDRKYAIFYREERTKRPINVKNIQTSLDTAVHGNFVNHYEVFSSFGDGGYYLRRQGNSLLPVSIKNSLPQTTNFLTLVSQRAQIGGNYVGGNSNRNPSSVPRTQDRTVGSEHIIRTRFSAPGSSETLSTGYLNISTQEYSVYNSLNFRNLSVRMTGSGETNRIRVDSHSHRREGLRMLRTRHQDQFGIDSQYGSISNIDYNSEASFNKQHRNNLLQGYLQIVNLLTPSYDSKNNTVKMRTNITTDPSAIVLSEQFAVVSCWIRLAQNISTDDRYVFNSNNNSGITFSSIFIDKNFKILTISCGAWFAKYDLTPYDLTGWNHIIAIYPASGYSGSSNVFRLFVNGNPLTSISSNTLFSKAGIVSYLYFGSNYGVATDNLQGQMALFSYYGRSNNSITSTEINQMRNDIDGSIVSGITGFKNFWSFDVSNVYSQGDVISNNELLEDYNSSYSITVVNPSNFYIANETPFEKPEGFVLKQRYNNDHYHSLLPASDFQYSWINSSISGSNWRNEQVVLGYSPSNGLIRTSSGIDSAIRFPGISELYGV